MHVYYLGVGYKTAEKRSRRVIEQNFLWILKKKKVIQLKSVFYPSSRLGTFSKILFEGGGVADTGPVIF